MRGIIFVFLICSAALLSCRQASPPVPDSQNRRVHITEDKGRYSLIRDGRAFFVKGALGHTNLPLIRQMGGNAINVYHQFVTNELLNEADSLGLVVAITLDIGRPHYGADYSDSTFIDAQRSWVRDFVTKYRDHPAVLFWIIGNEIHLRRYNNIQAWKEVNHLSKMIHRIDPNHLTTTALGEFPRKERQILQIKLFCPDLDFISLNSHMRNYMVRREVRNYIWGLDGPYLVTEWTGPIYWHNMDQSDWGAYLEPSSTIKADVYHHNYYVAIERDSDRCLGGFAFYWGEKQERTHTMFSLILENRYKTQAIEMLGYHWQRKWPEKWCPRIRHLAFRDSEGRKNLYLNKATSYHLDFAVVDPDSDPLRMKVEIMEEGKYRGIYGGDHEVRPPVVSTQYFDSLPANIEITTPDYEGAFRVFVYFYDPDDNVAVDNIPFYVLPI
jgi:hypothetical protein